MVKLIIVEWNSLTADFLLQMVRPPLEPVLALNRYGTALLHLLIMKQFFELYLLWTTPWRWQDWIKGETYPAEIMFLVTT